MIEVISFLIVENFDQNQIQILSFLFIIHAIFNSNISHEKRLKKKRMQEWHSG